MEIKEWSYEEFPEFTEEVNGSHVIETTGDETGVRYLHDIEYVNMGGLPLHLQILLPCSRNQPRIPLCSDIPGLLKGNPGEEELLPCVVFVQGSAWMKQDVYMQLPMLAGLAKRGYVVACAEYRHSGIAVFPAQAADAKNAVRFLRAHAKEFYIDADKMILAGDSSGGHTALFAGIMDNDQSEENEFPGISAEVKGMIDFYGSVSVMQEDGNPSTVNHHLPDSPEGRVMGGVNLRENKELCRRLSVECNISKRTRIAPVLIFHGTKDRTVNTRQSVCLYQHLLEQGKTAQLYLIRGADHGGPEFWTDEVLDIADDFIAECLKDS